MTRYLFYPAVTGVLVDDAPVVHDDKGAGCDWIHGTAKVYSANRPQGLPTTILFAGKQSLVV
jgi:hypothetical protein